LFCEKNKIPLIEIPFWEKDRIEEILDSLFNNKISFLNWKNKAPNKVKDNFNAKYKIIENLTHK
jgi:hypothetical protein